MGSGWARLVAPSWAFCAAALLSAGPAAAQVGPGSGSGARSVPNGSAQGSSSASKTGKSSPKTAGDGAHRIGRPPKSPRATLPAGVSPVEADPVERRKVAAGLTRSQRSQPVDDAELNSLRRAERVLFTRSLQGFRPGFDLAKLEPKSQARGLPPLAEAVPSATLSQAADLEWLRSLQLPDFPVRLTDRVVRYLKFYRDSKRGKAIARAWAAKSGRYTAAMRAEIARAGLPRDLVWLSLVESGHNPTIVSPAGAAGMWQFIPASARAYGLTVDRWVDERLDPQRATVAAAQYLSDLHQRFGSWDLAMAGYNMGHGGLARAIRKYNTNDFSRLITYEAGIPLETTLYVPKIAAIAIVMNNRRAFGIDHIKPDPAVSFDTVFVDPGVELKVVAKAAGIPIESLRSMNPQYRLGRVPPPAPATEKGSQSSTQRERRPRWSVRVPRGLGRRATQLLAKARLGTRFGSFVVRHGDTLATVAHRRKTTTKTLASLNQLRVSSRVEAGMVLLAPRLKNGEKLRADVEEAVVVPPSPVSAGGRRRVFYRVLSTDTLQGVAHAFGVSQRELATWNNLLTDAKLQSGMSLQVLVPPSADLSGVRYVLPKNTQLLTAGSEAMVSHFEAQNGRKRLVVLARQGDTLRTIGKRYGMSTGMMERINRFSRREKLTKGTRVIVYAKAGRSAKDTRRKPLAKVKAPVPSALP